MSPSEPVVLVPGGLYEDMDATRFWVEPGVAVGLEGRGFEVVALDRLRHPGSWAEEAAFLAGRMADHGIDRAAVVAGSNGCSAAVRLALDHPELVTRLVLCWPATAGDVAADRVARSAIAPETDDRVADALLAGDTLRGVSDDEVRSLRVPVAVVPSDPEDPFHRASTVVALGHLVLGLTVTEGFPESPRPEFADHRADFVATLAHVLDAR